MNKVNFRKILITVTVFCLLIVPPSVVWGTDASGVQNGANGSQPDARGSGGVSNFKIENPIKATNFEQFLADILNIIVQIGIPILVLMTIYAGFTFVTAAGDPGKIKQARSMFFNLIIGAFIVLGCFAISEALTNTVAELGPITVPGIGS